MMTEEEERIYDEMIEMEVATENELALARYLVRGSWEDALNKVCYIKTGYSTWEEFCECEYKRKRGRK